jgi:hypothetical protein
MHCSYIKCLADQYITGEIRSFTDPMLRKLPREIRDMIYEFLCEDSEEPFCVTDNNLMSPWSDEYCFEPLIKAFHLTYWMNQAHVGEEFASEAAHIWHKNARLSIGIKSLPALMYHVGGVLVGSGGPRMRSRELIRSLDVWMSQPPLYFSKITPLPSDKAAPYHDAARDLRTLLGPTGIKHKQGFKLRIIIPCWSIVFERYAEALCPVISMLRIEGFLVTVELERPSYPNAYVPHEIRPEDVASYFEVIEDTGERMLED